MKQAKRIHFFVELAERDGYTKHDRVIRHLTVDKINEDRHRCDITFRDADGTLLLWKTTHETSRYLDRILRKKEPHPFAFRIAEIRSGLQTDTPKIRITHVKSDQND